MDFKHKEFAFPVTVFDDFYEDPDAVREFALNQEYSNYGYIYPGLRSLCISTLNRDFWEFSYRKILSMFGDYSSHSDPKDFGAYSYFQKIYRFSDDPKDPVNDRWIHDDGVTNLAAVIYLDKKIYSDNGTSVYFKTDPLPKEKVITSDNRPEWFTDVLGKKETSDINSIKKYREGIVENNNQYSLTMEVKNRYNRAIIYPGNAYHGQTSYYMPNDEDFRLTQVFFFYEMEVNPILVPEVRCSKYGI